MTDKLILSYCTYSNIYNSILLTAVTISTCCLIEIVRSCKENKSDNMGTNHQPRNLNEARSSAAQPPAFKTAETDQFESTLLDTVMKQDLLLNNLARKFDNMALQLTRIETKVTAITKGTNVYPNLHQASAPLPTSVIDVFNVPRT